MINEGNSRVPKLLVFGTSRRDHVFHKLAGFGTPPPPLRCWFPSAAPPLRQRYRER